MALFLFGAGATRGASFVNPADNPCLPPLDFDFYAQLQRIANLKHKQTVRDVIKDTVDLFGINFQVTMESVFTTLEQTSRMIETTGETEISNEVIWRKRSSTSCKPLRLPSKSRSAQVVSGSALSAGTTERSLTS